MKKTLTILVLSLCIVASLVSGSLAIYQASIDVDEDATVIAKKFILDASGVGDDYGTAVDIAPGEDVTKSVAVVNYDGESIDNAGNVTEVPMKLDVTVDVRAAQGKQAIPVLVTNVYRVYEDGSSILVGSATGAGTITFTDTDAFTANVAENITYEILVEWPANGENDTAYQGDAFGNSILVKVTGTQVIE